MNLSEYIKLYDIYIYMYEPKWINYTFEKQIIRNKRYESILYIYLNTDISNHIYYILLYLNYIWINWHDFDIYVLL